MGKVTKAKKNSQIPVLDPSLESKALKAQRNEITEYHVYRRLSANSSNAQNKKILRDIAADELKHYAFWKKVTLKNTSPSRYKIWTRFVIAKLLGITFAMKLMEKGEGQAQETYTQIAQEISGLDKLIADEEEHEAMLVDLVDENRLNYVSSVLKGLNAAVVELVGSLAGLTLVFHDSHLIAVAGMVTGIAMTMSMVGTDYLGARTDSLFRIKLSENYRQFLKGPMYSGSTSLVVAFILTAPFLTFDNKFLALGFTFAGAMAVIFLFNFYVSITRDVSFVAKVREMALISISTAGLAFIGGHLIRLVLTSLDQI